MTYQAPKISEGYKSKIFEDEDIILHKYNLFQQFFVVGIEPKIVNLLNTVDFKSIPQTLIGPKIITKYPNINLPYLNIPDSAIISHCFPKGFKNTVIETEDNKLKDKLQQTYDFIFSLDNYQKDKNISLRANKVYYICYLFYEKLNDYQKCLEVKKSNIKEKNIISINNILIPKVICLSSFSPFITQSKQILHYLKKNIDKCNYFKFVGTNYNLPSLNNSENHFPIEKIIEGLIYNLPGLPRASFTIKVNKENFIFEDNENVSSSNLLENETQIIFENSPANKRPKPIINYALLMKFFKIEEIFEIIKYIILEEPILFFCKNIQYLTYTIEGILGLIYPFEYHFPVVSVLPEENYSFINIYKCFIFGINDNYSDDIFVLKGINIDAQKNVNIIIIENRFNNILNSNEKEKSKNSIILHLKPNNSKLVRISQNDLNNSISEIKDLYLKRKNMISELGKKKEEEEKNKEKVYDNSEDDRKIKLPIHYYVKCCKKIEANSEAKFKEAKSKIKDQGKDKNMLLKMLEDEKEKIFSDELTENFLYFFTSIFLHYQEYCTKYQFEYVASNEQSMSLFRKSSASYRDGSYFRSPALEKKYYTNSLTINDLFNCNLFIDEMPVLDKPFYTKFLQTKIFFNFMKKKIFPMSLQDKLDILFFDEKINEKLSRESGIKKIETKFLEYDIRRLTSDINVGYLSKPVTDDFKEYLSLQKNRDKALNYFQYITYQNIDTEQKKDTLENYFSNNSNHIKIDFYYFVFPKLLNDGVFYKPSKKDDKNSSAWSRGSNNFSLKNSDCLYNQFDKEASIIIKDENIIKNYYNYYYTLTLVKNNPKPYDYYIKNLYLQNLSKIFHQIPLSKKSYYFDYLMLFMNQYKDILDDNSIMMMFNTLIKHGDRNMAVNFFPFIRKKTYTTFLTLREKTRQDKNFIKFIKKDLKINLEDEQYTENNNNFNDFNDKLERSLSGYNISNIRLSSNSNLRSSNLSSYELDDRDEESGLRKIEKKEYIFIINNKIKYILNLHCTQKNENNFCNCEIDLKTNQMFYENKKYLEFQCPKCGKLQELTVTCEYNEDNNKNKKSQKYFVNTKLYSPLTLLENDWFKKSAELNLKDILEKYLDEYFCAIYYFYEQGLLFDFLLLDIPIRKTLTKENNISYNTYKQSTEFNGNKLIEINGNNGINLSSNYMGNVFDISDQKQNFFEFKNKNNKKAPSLVTSNLKKKVEAKKSVEFSNKNTTQKAIGFSKKNKKDMIKNK